MRTASSAAPTPITSEVRVPWITRLKMSRPSSSVPNRCAVVGGWRKKTLDRVGSYGASTGASSATAQAANTTTIPRMARGVILLEPDLRVDEGVENVGDQVHNH